MKRKISLMLSAALVMTHAAFADDNYFCRVGTAQSKNKAGYNWSCDDMKKGDILELHAPAVGDFCDLDEPVIKLQDADPYPIFLCTYRGETRNRRVKF